MPVERLWEVWTDPRQLERFWGPPEWPATFTRHALTVGGEARYYMTGPQGQKAEGYWRFLVIEQHQRFVVADGFSNEDGSPNARMPSMRTEFHFEATEKGSRFVTVTTFPSLEAMEQLVAMGMLEGSRAAMGQIDAVLEDLRNLSAGMPAALEVVDDTHVVVRRMVRGGLEQVWRAFNDKELLQQWLLGPDGWEMPVREVAAEIGATYRYEWERSGGGDRFGFTGQLLEQEAPRRSVTTEQMLGMEGTATSNELVLTPKPGSRTLVAITIEYPSRELRDLVLGTGMVDGMEASYARLERALDQRQTTMKSTFSVLAVITLALGLTVACSGHKQAESPDPVEGPAEEAGEAVDEAAEKAADKAEEAADDVEDAADEATN